MKDLLAKSLLSTLASVYIMSFTGCVNDRAIFADAQDKNTTGQHVIDPNGDDDGDGLTNGEEIELGTDPTKPDTDGDGLNDGLEVKIIGTDPLSNDSDKDGVTDGIEVVGTYKDETITQAGDITTANHKAYIIENGTLKLDKPISIKDFEGKTAANIHHNAFTDKGDKIDAWDPMNDSDYDTKQNKTEKTDGTNPLNNKDRKPWIYEVQPGLTMIEDGFTYIPGGFDLDGDGQPEGGFWMAQYEARGAGATTVDIPNLQNFTSQNFKEVNGVAITGYITSPAQSSGQTLLVPKYTEPNPSEESQTGMYGYEAMALVKANQIENGLPINLPSNKQYSHTVKLLENSQLQNIVKNSVLGYDANAAEDYQTPVYEIFTNMEEFSSNVMALGNPAAATIPPWWQANRILKNLTSDTAAAGYDVRSGDNGGLGLSQDPYAVMIRGFKINNKNILDLRHGIASGEQSNAGTIGIGFRAASDYLK